MKIILASASPRRKELLGHIFPSFEIQPAKGEETAVFTEPDSYVKELAFGKAAEIASTHFACKLPAVSVGADDTPLFSDPAVGRQNSFLTGSDHLVLVIGADTIVYANGSVLGKPGDEADAAQMLATLSGTSHEVYTGVSLLLLTNQEPGIFSCLKQASFSEKTTVWVSKLSQEEISAYIATGEPMDKAGSYGIQGAFSKHIEKIDGDYFNVVGLPVSRLYREIRSLTS